MTSMFDIIQQISILFGTIILTIYLYCKYYSFSYFERKNIPFIKPSFPFGNLNGSFYQKYGQELTKIHFYFKKHNVAFGGFYMLTKPVIVVVDPELIKNILIKDFHKFYSRGVYCNEEREFLSAHLFALSGQPWKKLRSKFTPAFSSSKLKIMLDTMVAKGANLEVKLQELAASSTAFDVKDLCMRLMTDITCTTIFGIDNNSILEHDNEFHKHGKVFFTNNLINNTKTFLAVTLPKLFDGLHFNFIGPEFTEYFVNSLKEVVHYREKNSIERPDFMNLMIKLKNKINIDDEKGNDYVEDGITMEQLLSQCFVLFLAGIDTSSTLVAFCIFELAQNEEMQNKLREEIHSTIKKHGGQLSYEAIMDMKFLDKVAHETLRKYPSVVVLNRIAVEDYTIPGTNTVIEKGTSIMISTIALHQDPEYYPSPEKFDPERFSEEEIAKRIPCTYLPFGEGPKGCLAYRHGLQQAKVGIIHMLNNFKFSLNSKTSMPPGLKTEIVVINTVEPIWLNVSKLN